MVLVWQTKPLHRFFRSAQQRLGTHHHQLHQGRFWYMETRQRDLVPTRWLVYKTQHCYESQGLCGQERSRKLRQLVWWQRICLGAGKPENRLKTDGGCLQRSRRIRSKCLYILLPVIRKTTEYVLLFSRNIIENVTRPTWLYNVVTQKWLNDMCQKKFSEIKQLFASGSANIGRRYSLQ